MNNIKNIIFDFGTVLLNIDYMKTALAFEQLGVANFHHQFAYQNQHQLFDDLEMGLITPEEFYDAIRLQTGLPLTNEQIEWAWNEILLDFPMHRVELMQKVKQHYRIFLLSNTNLIHVNSFKSSLNKIHNCQFLDTMFEKCYYSNDIRLRKPNKEIYNYILSDAKLNAAETVFIDDLKPNVDAAIEVGISGIYLPKEQDVTTLFSDKGFLLV